MSNLRIAQLPTPLDRMSRIGDRLGIDLWVKREDLSDTFLCGNKARKLAPLLPRAIEAGADTLVVSGGAQSNLCRVATLVAGRLGLTTELVVGVSEAGSAPAVIGNLLLSRLAGAQIHCVPMQSLLADAPRILGERADALRAAGRKPFVVPLGANEPAAILALSAIVEEIAAQLPGGLDARVTLVYPVASGGTAAGILFGLRRLGLAARAVGVVTTHTAEEPATRGRIARFFADAATAYAPACALDPAEIELLDGSGLGYGKNRPEELDLLVRLAADGLVLDETYNIKAMGIVHRERARLGERVVYVNTGGHFSLFAVGDPLLRAIERASEGRA